jgi:hypothetical protein
VSRRAQLAKRLRRYGLQVEQTSNQHLWIVAPDGRRIAASGTPSDWRDARNTASQLRRIGIEVPWKALI